MNALACLDTRPQSGIPFLLAVSLKNRGREGWGESERGKEGSRDVSWIHCDTFHVELFVLRVGVQFSGEYDTRKSGRPSPLSRLNLRACLVPLPPLHASTGSWTTIAVGQRADERGNGHSLDIRDTLMTEDVLQTTMYSTNTFYFLPLSFPLSFLPFLSLSLSFSGSKDRHVLTFPSILLKTSKTTPVTGFFLEEVPSSFLFFLFCAVRACSGKEYRL